MSRLFFGKFYIIIYSRLQIRETERGMQIFQLTNLYHLQRKNNYLPMNGPYTGVATQIKMPSNHKEHVLNNEEQSSVLSGGRDKRNESGSFWSLQLTIMYRGKTQNDKELSDQKAAESQSIMYQQSKTFSNRYCRQCLHLYNVYLYNLYNITFPLNLTITLWGSMTGISTIHI